MSPSRPWFVFACVPALLAGSCSGPRTEAARDVVTLPDTKDGVPFDDLWYSAPLGEVVVAAGRSGDVDLVGADSLELTKIAGMSDGTESAGSGGGFVVAADRSNARLLVIDPAKKAVVGSIDLGGNPDYVRFVEATSEAWVTEPGGGRIEILTVSKEGAPQHAAYVDLLSGPEGIVIDEARMRAYVQRSNDVVSIDIAKRDVAAVWPTGCQGTHGIPALDGKRGLVLAGCADAEIVALDVATGAVTGRFHLGSGASLMGYSALLQHAYLRGDPGSDLAVLGLSPAGALTLLGKVNGSDHGHCLTADDRGHVWTGDRDKGTLVRVTDPFPAGE